MDLAARPTQNYIALESPVGHPEGWYDIVDGLVGTSISAVSGREQPQYRQRGMSSHSPRLWSEYASDCSV
jgi:hypothetical protein